MTKASPDILPLCETLLCGSTAHSQHILACVLQVLYLYREIFDAVKIFGQQATQVQNTHIEIMSTCICQALCGVGNTAVNLVDRSFMTSWS